jgi:hypothetical protein
VEGTAVLLDRKVTSDLVEMLDLDLRSLHRFAKENICVLSEAHGQRPRERGQKNPRLRVLPRQPGRAMKRDN